MEHIPNEYVTEERHCRNQKGPQDMCENISTDCQEPVLKFSEDGR
jgi:hypothetical protein